MLGRELRNSWLFSHYPTGRQISLHISSNLIWFAERLRRGWFCLVYISQQQQRDAVWLCWSDKGWKGSSTATKFKILLRIWARKDSPAYWEGQHPNIVLQQLSCKIWQRKQLLKVCMLLLANVEWSQGWLPHRVTLICEMLEVRRDELQRARGGPDWSSHSRQTFFSKAKKISEWNCLQNQVAVWLSTLSDWRGS